MRQRRVTGIEERLEPYADLILRGTAGTGAFRDLVGREKDKSAESPRLPASGVKHPRWYQRPSPRYELPEGFGHIYAEFGCGRGLFINAMAEADPEGLYVGIEGCKTIVIRGLEKTRAKGLSNVRYIDDFINDAVAAFGTETLSGVFLNFSDPWPKDRHADRRLTAPKKAEAYYRTLTPGGFVSFKTDGEKFFTYSLAAFSEAGFQIAGAACDIATAVPLAGPAERAALTPTEYELKFRAENKPIYRFTAIKKV